MPDLCSHCLLLCLCRVLMLGAGFVTKPTLEILANSGVTVSVGKIPPSIRAHLILFPILASH